MYKILNTDPLQHKSNFTERISICHAPLHSNDNARHICNRFCAMSLNISS